MELRVEGVAEAARGVVVGFVEAVAETLGERFHSAVVSGEAVQDDFVPGRSAISVALLVADVAPEVVAAVGEAWRPRARKGLEPPLLITPEELARSLDTWPVEFLNLRLTGQVVAGPFELDTLAVKRAHLRLQCERELRGLVIHSRLAAIRFADSEKDLGQALAAGTGKLGVLLRAVDYLLGGDGLGSARQVLAALRTHWEEDLAVLDDVFALGWTSKPRFAREQLLRLSAVLDAMVERVDQVNPNVEPGA